MQQQPIPAGGIPKPNKKGGKGKIFLFVGLAVLALAVAGLWLLGGDTEENETAYVSASDTQTSLTGLVKELSAGGESLAPGYAGGEYGVWGVEQQPEDLRAAYTQAEDAESVTWIVYMVGSNLESEGGAASTDLQEMIHAENGTNLNVVVETGGAAAWQMEGISADTRQRWLIQDGQMTLCDDIGQGSMCTREALADCIAWAAQEFPADRYMLTLWDHGGGTIGGFGWDENYEEDSLSLADMAGAIADSGVALDMMSFDACLMGTLETAYAFEPYADYLLASEETEPGDGWYYTDALAALSERPNMPTVELGARLIDDYGCYYGNDSVTLSLIDLREISALYSACEAYYAGAQAQLKAQQGFTKLSTARSGSRSYADGEYEQIDLVDYVQRTDVAGGEALIRAAFSAVKYRNASTLEGSYGVATYFPYTSLDAYQGVMQELAQVNCTGAEEFYDAFLSILAGGSGGTQNAISQLTGYTEPTQDYSSENWYDPEASDGQDYDTVASADELALDYNEAAQAYTLSLPEDTWDAVTDVQLQVMLDDGEGYIDLGSDQRYDWADDGSLLVDFDNTWTAINGCPVAFYAAEPVTQGDITIFTGTVPALLNDEQEVDLYLEWQQDAQGETNACVLGYLPKQASGQALPKGYFALQSGDVIQPLCDYYTYDGEYDDSYFFGEPIQVTSQEALTVDSYDLEDATTICWIRLTDWYQQYWYTETVEISY